MGRASPWHRLMENVIVLNVSLDKKKNSIYVYVYWNV